MPQPIRGLGMRRLIVARLAEANGAVVTHAALIAAVYGDAPPAWARTSIQSVVSRLRCLWAGIETYHGTGYRLRPESDLAKAILPSLDDRGARHE